MFGGLALCSLEAVVAKDGKEYIIEVNDCAMGLLGESQEDDRRNIAEVVIKEMEVQNFVGQLHFLISLNILVTMPASCSQTCCPNFRSWEQARFLTRGVRNSEGEKGGC